jgi:hypothetical protein
LVVKQLIAGGDRVKGKHLNPAVRTKSKKQNLVLRKKADRTGWKAATFRRQSDADILLDIQLRFETLGGEGFASPQKAMLLSGNKTRFFGNDTKLGLRAVSMVKRKRWRDLPCF